jgi:hypothetical protein
VVTSGSPSTPSLADSTGPERDGSNSNLGPHLKSKLINHILTRKRPAGNPVFVRVAQGSPHVGCDMRWVLSVFRNVHSPPSPEISNATISRQPLSSGLARCGTTEVATRVLVRSVWTFLSESETTGAVGSTRANYGGSRTIAIRSTGDW